MGLRLQILRVSTNREIETAFETLAREPAGALFVSSDGLPPACPIRATGGTAQAARDLFGT